MASTWNELLLANDKFCKWFWTGKNGNKLIHELNDSKHRSPETDFVCRGKRTVVYAIALNYPFDLEDGQTKWKFCKIGLTRVDTTEGTGNRMETVMKKIDNRYQCEDTAEKLFALPINPTDHREDLDVENSIRDAFGYKVPKEKAKKLHFPTHTEWVITTQDFINNVKDRVEDMRERYGHATTAVFGEYFKFQSDKHPLPDALDKLCFPSQEELEAFADMMGKTTTPAGGAMGLDDSMLEWGFEDSTMSP